MGSGQSYGDSGPFNLQSGPVDPNEWVVTPSTAEPTLVEICAGGYGLVITGIDFINDTAGTTAPEVLHFQKRPRPGTEGSETNLGSATITVAQMTTVGDIIRCNFQSYAESGVNQSGFTIPPGQSFVVASDGDSTAWKCVCVPRGYTIPWGSNKVQTAGELVETGGKTIYNVVIGAAA